MVVRLVQENQRAVAGRVDRRSSAPILGHEPAPQVDPDRPRRRARGGRARARAASTP